LFISWLDRRRGPLLTNFADSHLVCRIAVETGRERSASLSIRTTISIRSVALTRVITAVRHLCRSPLPLIILARSRTRSRSFSLSLSLSRSAFKLLSYCPRTIFLPFRLFIRSSRLTLPAPSAVFRQGFSAVLYFAPPSSVTDHCSAQYGVVQTSGHFQRNVAEQHQASPDNRYSSQCPPMHI
jgi:hypothetical protein